MTRTLGSPKIIRLASHHSTNVYRVPQIVSGPPRIQICVCLCPQDIFSAFSWRKLKDYSGKDELGSQVPCNAKERDHELRKWSRYKYPLNMS